MQIILKTYVEQSPLQVLEGFTQELFIKLKPPGVRLKLLRFDGSKTGDIVEMELNFGLFKQKWTSIITDHGQNEAESYFVDEATTKNLPFFLIHWKHRHRLVAMGSGTEIIDHIQYRAPFGLNLLLYPILYLQFAYRKPIYRKTFVLYKKEERQ